MSSTIFEELKDAMAAVMVLHNEGCDSLAERTSPTKLVKLTVEHISNVVIDVSTEMAAYDSFFKVHPTKLDLTKVLTFTASCLRKADSSYSAFPLFYSYLNFLDDSYQGLGFTLREFGESAIYAENLSEMLTRGESIAPFCWFRAIDLSFDRCAIPRIEGLMKEVEDLKG